MIKIFVFLTGLFGIAPHHPPQQPHFEIYISPEMDSQKYERLVEPFLDVPVVIKRYLFQLSSDTVSIERSSCFSLNPNGDKNMMLITNFRFFGKDSTELARGKNTKNIIFIDELAIKNDLVFKKIFCHEVLHRYYGQKHCDNEYCIMHRVKDGETLCPKHQIKDNLFFNKTLFGY